MPGFVTYEMIYDAFKDCSKNKKRSRSFLEFDFNRAINLSLLMNELNDGTYEIGCSNCFVVTDPKPREVFAANFRDRIVHHLIINKFNDSLFEPFFIENTYNCRKGKGTFGGINCALRFVCEMTDYFQNDCWVLKCDIKNFFMSIKKDLLAKMLSDFVDERYDGADKQFWIDLIVKVTLHRPLDNCVKKGDLKKWDILPKEKSMFLSNPNYGLAVGNLTSQIFANFYMSPFDHFMTSFKNIRYCRYVDDFVIVGKDKAELLELMDIARRFLFDNYGLKIHNDKWTLLLASKGFTFLGNVIKKDKLYVINRTANSGIKAASQTKLSVEKMMQIFNCYLGFVIHTESFKIRKAMLSKLCKRYRKVLYFDEGITKLNMTKAYKKIHRRQTLDYPIAT